MATLKTATTIAGQTAWHAGNDGSGSGLDADTVDGLHATQLGVAQIATSAPTPRAVGDLWTGETPVLTFDSGWIIPTLVNSWVNYAGGYTPARYRKLVDGIVMMQGLIKGGANGSVCFTLPVGYRPEYSQLMASSNNDCNVGRLNIHSDGRVRPEATIGDVTGWYALDVLFYAG